MTVEMNYWVTIKNYSLPHEAHLAKTYLENEGIEVFLKDELTTQIYNFYSNAIGGVKLQVRPENELRAKQILGQNVYELNPTQPNPIVAKINAFSDKVPFVNTLEGDVKIFVGLSLLISLIVVGLTLLYLFLQ